MITVEQDRADHLWMARAVRLAAAVFPPPHPNPRVGCVIVKNGRAIGEGVHSRAGMPHAEIEALGNCAKSAYGATVYVTLEPCSHFGRTPPCADALIDAGVQRVVVGHTDPSTQGSGRGVARLRQAGIDVRQGLLEQDARSLNQGFLHRIATGLPWVTVKLAASMDGGTALKSGDSRWITSAQARRDVHWQRAKAGAIVSSSATVRVDDPLLNVRLEPELEVEAQPLRVILDPLLTVPAEAKLFSVAGPLLIVHGVPAHHVDRDRLAAAGAELVQLGMAGGGRINLAAMLELLGKREVNSVWVEAGSTLAGELLRLDLVNELIVYMAPHLLGETAQPLVRLGELENMEQRRELYFHDIRRVGEEIKITARPK